MSPQPQQILELLTGTGGILGRLVVEEVRDGLVLAQFTPGPAFPEVKPLFDDFEDAVNQQMFTLADKVAAAIEALGLSLRSIDGGQRMPVHDVQIMSGHDLSCRVPSVTAATPIEETA